MKELIGAAIAAGATMAGVGVANAGVAGSIQVTSDYVFRGLSLNNNDPAFQGGVDWGNDGFYVGTWGSTVVDGIEVDVYAGWTPKTGPVSWDLGVISYNYPGAHDSPGARFDFYELKAAGSMDIMEHIILGAALYYSPANYGGTGHATYWEANGVYTVNDALNFTAAFGNQEIQDADGPGPVVTHSSNYNTWNIGATYTWRGFEFDLRYHDTDIKAGSDIEHYTYGPSSYHAGVNFTIKRAL
ncbi:MAG: hypothetical protein JSS00_06340 [Proteobacteria bacterium]|nr:hypothetical protein [Pseudomonadota bacterium]